MSYQRSISQDFVWDLKEGNLSPVLQRVKQDETLMLALRDGYINIYYRGGNLLRIEEKGSGKYSVSFDTKYNKIGALTIPVAFPFSIAGAADAVVLVDAVPTMKHAMDRYLSEHRKSEREFQQLVARENNHSPISNETEYFIVDIEVAGALPGSRFDMLAVRWLRSERKRQGTLVPVLIEMKYGSGALNGGSGLQEHLQDARTLHADPGSWEVMHQVLEEQVNQLADLGLLHFNRSEAIRRLVLDREAKPELIFLLANQNPASTKLATFLADLERSVATGQDDKLDILFFVASFAGYGLHRACMHSLSDFRAMVERSFEATRMTSTVIARAPGSVAGKTVRDAVRRVVLTTETSGLGPGHRVIELACVEMLGLRVTGKFIHMYLNPERDIDPAASAVHGLSEEFLADKPRFRDVAADFVAFVRGAELVMHHAPFGEEYLDHELDLIDLPPLKKIGTGIIDTLVMARKRRPDSKNSIEALCDRYRIDIEHRPFHGTLLDAQITAEVFIAMDAEPESL